MKVFTVHGIRRKQRWYESFEMLEGVRKSQIDILKFEFGFFSIWDFLSKKKRETVIDEFCAFYSEKMLNSAVIPCAIAHSFGTYILFKAMKRYDSIKFDRIIFCGTILNSELDFRELFEKGQVKYITNDFGEREWFVGITRFVIDKYCGKAGRIGFVDIPPKFETMFTNRKNYLSHSDYFLPIHMKENWLPFIAKSKDKYNFKEDILRRDVIERIYKNISKAPFECTINEVKYSARIDSDGNYFAKYEQLGLNDNFNKTIDYLIFTTSSDSFQDANNMNLIAYDLNSNSKLTYDVQENIVFQKTFKIHLHKPVNYKEQINTKFYFNLNSTMNLIGGDVDHYVIKDISNVSVQLNFPNELKLPKIFEIKDREIVGQKNIQKKVEIDGTVTYFLQYNNQNNNEGLMFYYEGLTQGNSISRKPKSNDFKLSIGKKINEYTVTEAAGKDIRKIYKIECEVEMNDSANENTLEQRRRMFNEGFLIVKNKKSGEVIGYLESIIWNEKPFETFEEISNFPMHYNVNGDTLYVIFLAVTKLYRKKGFASKLVREIENVAKKYKVRRIRLVAKDNLVSFYSKLGFNSLTEMPAFLKGKPYKSVLMEKTL